MKRSALSLLLAISTAGAASPAAAQRTPSPMHDRRTEIYDTRMADWRTRQVVYQVFVDRFAPSGDPARKASLYESPRRLRPWTEAPKKGTFLREQGVWSHEIDFWGGDLRGLTSKLDYIASLGANVLYLNPIFLAYTNHKYDATDFHRIDPQYGTEEDLARLCEEAHRRGIRVVLDGVFNHAGLRNVWFRDALSSPESRYRGFFTFGKDIKNGYRGWIDLPNHPELNFENPEVRRAIYGAPDSVVQKWLKYADGWRLDVAFELGPEVLAELTAAAHQARHDAYTVGENYNYPAGWMPALDGVYNMTLAYALQSMAQGKMTGPVASELVEQMVEDTGIEPLLRCWIVLSNHDRPRLKTAFPELRDRTFLVALQIALPGAPLVYYGEEAGMAGGEDPEQRAPMDWDAVEAGRTPELELFRSLVRIRNERRALQVGDFKRLASERLFAFLRYTDSVRDSVIVVANPTNAPVTETLSTRDGFLQDDSPMRDLLSKTTTTIRAGLVTVTVPPKTVQLLVPVIDDTTPNYNRYKRVP